MDDSEITGDEFIESYNEKSNFNVKKPVKFKILIF